MANKNNIKNVLLTQISAPIISSGNKVSIVGVGQVGMASAFSILTQNVSSHICLVDQDKDRLEAELMDLQHGSSFVLNAKIEASTDYAITRNSKLCIVTAGARQLEGETRLDLVQRNVHIMKQIIPQLVKYSPNTIILMVSNPVDILTYAAWKFSGLPKHKVIGSGTNLDSSRFRFLLSTKLGVAPTSCHGYIIGEHGDSSVPIWSGVNVAGVRLSELNPEIGSENDEQKWNELHKEVVESSYRLIKLKGYTSWAIGLSVSDLSGAILRNTGDVHSVSTLIKGLYGITDDIFLSLPALLGENGVTHVVNQKLTAKEQKQLQDSARTINKVQAGIKF